MKIAVFILIFTAVVVVSVVLVLSRKKPQEVSTAGPKNLLFSQLDITEKFGDNLRLGPEDWIQTSPLNFEAKDPVASGLPLPSASEDEVYAIASKLSRIREQMLGLRDDGVYCPICHIANKEISRLGTPCPKCNRPLLQFGWD